MGSLVRNIRWIVVGTVVMIVLFAGVPVVLMRRADFGSRSTALPFPGQVAAMVKSVERAPEEDRGLLVNAFDSPIMNVQLVDAPPQSRGNVTMPGLEFALHTYLSALDGRSLDTFVDVTSGPGLVLNRKGESWATRPIRLVVGLKTGGYLVIDTRTPVVDRINGIGLSLFMLLATLLVAAFAVYLLTRQLRPLMRLSQAVERFGTNLESSNLPDDGAKEVRDLTNAFRSLQTRIRDLVAGRTRMMAAISHDLGTYLTRLRLRIEFIEDAEERARAEREIADMQNLISGTLTLAKLDHDAEPLEPADIAEILHRRAGRFAAGGLVRFDGPEPVIAMARPAALARAFDNLIANALKYGGEADIAVHAAGGEAEVLIQDRGPGIPPEAREAVLEPFFRGDPARNLDEAGFGLGLAIVAEILKRHQASLSFEDRPGGGLTVRVRLALARHA